MATTYLTRAAADFGTPTNRKKCTISFWLKRSSLTVQQAVMGVETTPAGGANEARFILRGDDTIEFYDYQSGYKFRYITNRLIRDTSGWYNIVLAVDTTHPTGSERVKIYINGVQETSFSSSTDPAQDLDTFINSGNYLQIGRQSTGNSYLNGSLSHYNFIDGTTYDATAFGSTDNTTGEWKINTSPSVTYGTNGFFILKNGNSLTDESTNTNNFTLGSGTLTNTLDCPSNVFATFNPLYSSGGTVTYSNGNNTFTEPDSQWKTTFSTLGASSGKYYAEFKSNGNYTQIGVADYNVTKYGTADYNFASSTVISTQGYGYYNGNGDLYYRGSSTSYGDTYGNGDIIQVGLDCDNNRVFFGKNGVWQNSADPTNSGTGFAMTATNATYVFALAVTSNPCDANFGNGFFGTSAVADNSTATASTPGTFNYDVPTGYQPLSTKGLNA
jgi:hypothetical protein